MVTEAKMRRKSVAAAILFGLIAGAAVSGEGRYMRKQLQPDFFMPEKVLFNQPEKLPPLPEVKKSSDMKKTAAVAAENNTVLKDEENLQTAAEAVPEYQTKFDDYNRDIDYISRSGEIPVNARLNADLEQMKSNELFRVTPKPYQQTAVSRAFNKALEDVLAENRDAVATAD